MGVGKRRPLSAAQVDEVWARWRSGQAVRVLSRQMRVSPSTVRALLLRAGGIGPVPRRRASLRLSLTEREEISRGLAAGLSLRAIARSLGRAASTISREVDRGGRRRYRAAWAEQVAWDLATRPKPTKLSQLPALAQLVAAKLALDWSPQQIAGWLKAEYPEDAEMHVSHETIYRSLFVQSRGELRKELTRHLRTGRATRRPAGQRQPDGRGGRPNILHISQRPAEAEDRAVPGHWEGDLVFGRGMSPLATLVERSTRFLMLVALPAGNHRADVVADALAAKITTLPAALRRTLTWDQGQEMAAHARFTIDTGIQVYFCDPKSPWQRGSNENINGLLRQYLPRTVDMRDYTQTDFDTIADQLNGRPRQTLGFKTPSQALAEVLR